jgi:hypothetical protein
MVRFQRTPSGGIPQPGTPEVLKLSCSARTVPSGQLSAAILIESVMAERLLACRLITPGTAWALAVMAAILVFYGTWAFLGSHPQGAMQPGVGAITHSAPVGGKVEDGVFRSSPDTGSAVNLWQI